ncbi:MAG: response regulator [Phycisphaerae bacterium]|nr:response regulator [Phycisphaerae bacterium]MDD5381180.1 response regulator [Phycisphaerae bacterium]
MKKILVVDDEKDMLLVLEKRLIAEGYSVITTTKGRNAVSLAKSHHPDLVILDVVMPGMDGGEVAEKLKEHPLTRSIPVIFLTALLTKTEEFRGDHTISNNITFAKPVNIAELLARIKELLCSAATS